MELALVDALIETGADLNFNKDGKGEAALSSLQAREDTPEPNRVLKTSPGKLQVVWKVEKGSRSAMPSRSSDASRADFGADPAVTDTVRVLRLPGFLNPVVRSDRRIGNEDRVVATE